MPIDGRFRSISICRPLLSFGKGGGELAKRDADFPHKRWPVSRTGLSLAAFPLAKGGPVKAAKPPPKFRATQSGALSVFFDLRGFSHGTEVAMSPTFWQAKFWQDRQRYRKLLSLMLAA